MSLSKDSIEEFRSIWKREFGEDISPGEAEMKADLLLEFAMLLCKTSEPEE